MPGFDGFLKGDGSPGDVIILTKSLGTGALWAADMRVKCDGVMREEAIGERVQNTTYNAESLREHPGPRSEATYNDVMNTSLFAARFARHCRFLAAVVFSSLSLTPF